MSDAIADLVDRFMRLTPEVQTEAYLEIEATWKGQQDNGPTTQ